MSRNLTGHGNLHSSRHQLLMVFTAASVNQF
ncbi:uncharacterized protein METZ01_LOCUS105496 [marine metagenome]|uniref:Uncharacterized protein n=1 Tax=marine metagenome TaxID=408172 RepID=A0A381WJL6_9ZZZZ